MKIQFKQIILSAVLALAFTACSDWTTPEAEELQNLADNSSTIEKTEEYWENLRAYKKSDHQLAFGWYGYWDGGIGTTTRGSLASTPDSMDIISIVSKYRFPLDEKRIADMRYVQEVKGTKVVFMQGMQNILFDLPNDTSGIVPFANALCDTVDKYGYDGLDLDYEPNYGGSGFFDNKNYVLRFVQELSKRLGPKSGTDKLLILDGEVAFILPEVVQYFNYGISQAYRSTNNASLDSRWARTAPLGWKPEQYLICEEFQQYGTTGGVNFTLPSGEVVPSLIGMALWHPEDGKRKGGCGTFMMQFDYNNTPDYKYMRQAIQIMNPAVK